MPPLHPDKNQPLVESPAIPAAQEDELSKIYRRSRAKKNSSCERKREWRFALLSGCVDITTWMILCQAISAFTGSYNAVTPDVLLVPVVVLMLSIALVGAYRFKRDFASLQYHRRTEIKQHY